jgi:glycosyltransferase involved in cell wall biosynthesis
LEALASGTPVVGLSNETIDEFIDETCGYCLPKKTAPPEFARKVKAICSLPKEEYEKLRKRASKKVQFLDWQEIVPQTIAVYRRLAEREREKNKKFFLNPSQQRIFRKKCSVFLNPEEKGELK